jgi:hypothetical protein
VVVGGVVVVGTVVEVVAGLGVITAQMEP